MEMIKGDVFEEKVLKSDKPVLVDFFATWCGPCRVLTPVLSELAEKWKEELYVYQMDIDEPENRRLVQMYGVQSVPNMVFIKNGRVVDRVIGLCARSYIEKAIRKTTEAT